MSSNKLAGVLNDSYLQLKEESQSRKSCQSFVFTATLWLVFVITRLSHRQVSQTYSLSHSLKDILQTGEIPTKNVVSTTRTTTDYLTALLFTTTPAPAVAMNPVQLSKANSWGGMFDWMQATFIPFFWAPAGHGPGVVLDFNRVIGGSRLLQKRLVTKECVGPGSLNGVYNMSCTSKGGEFDTGPIAAFQTAGAKGGIANSKNQYVYWLSTGESKNSVLASVQSLRDRKWTVSATQSLNVQSLLYNGQAAMFVFIDTAFTLDRAGALKPELSVKVLPAQIYATPSSLSGDVVMLVLILWLLSGEALGANQAMRDQRLSEYCHEVVRMVNWSIILMGVAFAIFNGYIANAMSTMVDDIRRSMTTQGIAREEQQRQLDTVYDKVSRLSDESRWCDLMAFWYMLIILVKVFHTFEGNPRLKFVSDTFREAFGDLFHFLIIFSLLFTNFALGANFLFGQQLSEWSSVVMSLNSGFRALMGDFDYTSLHETAPVNAFIWFWLYMVFICLVCVNMLLAIVMDSYTSVKSKTEEEGSFWDSAVNVWNQLIGSGKVSPTGQASSPKAQTPKSDEDHVRGLVAELRELSQISDVKDNLQTIPGGPPAMPHWIPPPQPVVGWAY